jgi:hypothetical protein
MLLAMNGFRTFARGDLRPWLSLCSSALLALTAILTAYCNANAAEAAEPATVEQAERLLDLRTFPMLEGGKVAGRQSLGIVMYEAPGEAATAFEFLRKQLTMRGWKELPGGYKDANNASGGFQKQGFNMAVSTSSADGAEKSGRVNVTLVNHGNVDLAKLPTPPGVKPFSSYPGQTSYLTEAKVPETAEACRKLLVDAGWEPYGTASADPQSPMLYFKRNAIRLMAWISTAPAQGNKTVIQYSTDLLSADLPMPLDAPDPRYDDTQKTVRFDWPGEDGSKVIEFYQTRLTDKNWKATTDHPITDDSKGTQFLIFRNPQGDLISLDLQKFTDIVRVIVRHQSAAEVAESDRLFKEEIARRKLEKERRQITVDVPLPATAGKLKQPQPDSFEFTLGKGQSAGAFEALREHFVNLGWSEAEGTSTDATVGRMEFKKGESVIRFRYFDIGIGDAELSVNGSEGVTLAPKVSKDKLPPVADKPVADKPTAGKSSAAKRPTIADIPGIGELPAGVELPEMPAEVGDLLKSLNNSKGAASGGKNGKPQQAPAGKSPATAGNPAKVAEISIPAFATSVEYNKTTKMIKLTSSSDVGTLAEFFRKELGDKGWAEPGKPLINEGTAILKLSRGEALLTIFVHKQDDGSDATITCNGVVWDVTPASRVAPKKTGQPRTAPPSGSAPAPRKSAAAAKGGQGAGR